eukprot:CAMPEP_0182446428 /NCGR_PEP_ID=MMETSP1172-20130603/4199_1 /TAXON_ID=708627 /ORGANISM="Timspurckia oligopyrenoides, Strain CCMP3278" /LENGTH=465 /DNA_ID=CAMNT_0024642359 /DNA_START=15 /DNA_END=1412 /DNA_ORIENTATION=+
MQYNEVSRFIQELTGSIPSESGAQESSSTRGLSRSGTHSLTHKGTPSIPDSKSKPGSTTLGVNKHSEEMSVIPKDKTQNSPIHQAQNLVSRANGENEQGNVDALGFVRSLFNSNLEFVAPPTTTSDLNDTIHSTHSGNVHGSISLPHATAENESRNRLQSGKLVEANDHESRTTIGLPVLPVLPQTKNEENEQGSGIKFKGNGNGNGVTKKRKSTTGSGNLHTLSKTAEGMFQENKGEMGNSGMRKPVNGNVPKKQKVVGSPSVGVGVKESVNNTGDGMNGESSDVKKRDRERRRREKMNVLFDELLSAICRDGSNRPDKETIMSYAIEHIKEQNDLIAALTQKNKALQGELDVHRSEKLELRNEKNLLRSELSKTKAEYQRLEADHMVLWKSSQDPSEPSALLNRSLPLAPSSVHSPTSGIPPRPHRIGGGSMVPTTQDDPIPAPWLADEERTGDRSDTHPECA